MRNYVFCIYDHFLEQRLLKDGPICSTRIYALGDHNCPQMEATFEKTVILSFCSFGDYYKICSFKHINKVCAWVIQEYAHIPNFINICIGAADDTRQKIWPPHNLSLHFVMEKF